MLLVLVPQAVELETLCTAFAEFGHPAKAFSAGRIQLREISALQLAIGIGGHGKAQFALQTQYLLDRLKGVEGVVCTGGAGGLDSRLAVGDIVVGTATVEHDYRIRFVQVPLKEHPGCGPWISELQTLSKSFEVGGKMCFDRIASGDEDIVALERASQLRDETRAASVAWEGSGGARAAEFNQLPFIEIRGITDAANEAAHGDYHENLRIVMPRIAQLLIHWRELSRNL